MESEADNVEFQAIKCATGCGFYGSRNTMDLCSKCYRSKYHKEEQQLVQRAPKTDGGAKEDLSAGATLAAAMDLIAAACSDLSAGAAAEATTEVVAEVPAAAVVEEVPAAAADDTPVEEAKPAGPARCSSCKRKVGFTGFKCRCEQIFCSMHRYEDQHDCRYDFKSAARAAIAKANPVIKAPKIEKL